MGRLRIAGSAPKPDLEAPEKTNLELAAVVETIIDLPAHDMLDALPKGETNPEVLAR